MTPDGRYSVTNLQTLTIREIATWALPHAENTPKPRPLVVLPKLQRSPAWKSEQIERLWDSLVRGFPVGSFLVSPCGKRGELGEKGFALQETHDSSTLWRPEADDWYLLDGQQRATAIALGFFNPWTNAAHRLDNLRYTLWVDLDPADEVDERVFVFRLLTRSHPWGYQRLYPRSPLTATNRRQAAEEFEQANNDGPLKAGRLPLRAIPFDAKAPVPVAILFECIGVHNLWQALREKIDQIWPDTNATGEKAPRRLEQRKRIDTLLSTKPVQEHMTRLVEGLQRLIKTDQSVFGIPALIVPSDYLSRPQHPDLDLQREDPIATLFIRVNSAGTVPSREELAYSLLKSEWPDCHQLVEELPHAFLPPALMVAQFSSLILADAADTERSRKPPAFPDLRTFRRLVHRRVRECEDFLDRFKRFLDSRRGMEVIKAAGRIMLYDETGERPFRLLPAQGAQLARRSRRTFFLFLSWINSRPNLQDPWLGLDEAAHRRVLGVITALSWFGWYEEDCVAELWQVRNSLDKLGTLARVSGVRDGRFGLLPLPPPPILQAIVQNRVTKAFGNADADLWSRWGFWRDFAKDPHDIGEARDWYAASVQLQTDGSEGDIARVRSDAWANFLGKLIGLRELLLYAQRGALFHWFREFDPTSAEQLEDTDQPWDFDHILPNAYRSAHHVPQVIREWQSSIGNLRAWPAELNRSDRAIRPAEKLCGTTSDEYSREVTVYNLYSPKSRLDASAVTDEELQLWSEACPEGVRANYLADPENNDKRFKVLQVITGRWVRLYQNWFEELRIAELTCAHHQ
jgi:hypothetical protein